MRPNWEHFEHGADTGIRGWGKSLQEAFEQGALALTAAVCEPSNINLQEKRTLECENSDNELLFVDWLNKIIYEMDVSHMLFGAFKVKKEGAKLYGTAWGEELDTPRHQPVVEVKGATYTELKVVNENGDWRAQCVIDV